MEKLEAYKNGHVESGNWHWAVGSPPNAIGHRSCLATINLHGCVALRTEPEDAARLLASAPELAEANDALEDRVTVLRGWLTKIKDHPVDPLDIDGVHITLQAAADSALAEDKP